MKKFILVILSNVSIFGFAQTDIFTTDFQNGIPLSYTLIDNDGLIPAAQVSEYTSAWITVLDPENLTDTIAASTSYFSPSGTASRWLITAPFTTGSFGNFIEWEAKSQDAAVPDDYLVLVSTTDNQIASFTDTVGYIIEENFEWTTRTVNLSTYNNQAIYIAFVNITNDGFKLYINDIHAWNNDPVSVIELNQNNAVSIYPNPTKGMFSVESESESEIQNVIVSNSFGQIVFTTKQTKIDLSNYSNGIYFLKIETTTGSSIKKIIKN